MIKNSIILITLAIVICLATVSRGDTISIPSINPFNITLAGNLPAIVGGYDLITNLSEPFYLDAINELYFEYPQLKTF